MKHQVQHKLLSIRRKRKQINEQPELRGIIADPIQSDEFRKDLFLVRPLENAEKGKALQLAWKVFCEFESPDYAPEGTEEFKKCLNDDAYLAGIRYYGGFDEEKLVGMLGIREEKRHVCFFFVDGEYQIPATRHRKKAVQTDAAGFSRTHDHAQFLSLRAAVLQGARLYDNRQRTNSQWDTFYTDGI